MQSPKIYIGLGESDRQIYVCLKEEIPYLDSLKCVFAIGLYIEKRDNTPAIFDRMTDEKGPTLARIRRMFNIFQNARRGKFLLTACSKEHCDCNAAFRQICFHYIPEWSGFGEMYGYSVPEKGVEWRTFDLQVIDGSDTKTEDGEADADLGDTDDRPIVADRVDVHLPDADRVHVDARPARDAYLVF